MSGAVASPSNGHVGAAALRLLGDGRLVRRAANGDREAFAVLYRRHHQALYRYCRAILGNGEDAADALQNTMAAALRALPGEEREIRVKPWLFRIAHNESVSLLRRRAPHAGLEAAEHVAAPAGSDPETRARIRQLVTDLHELPDRQRAALVMRELNDFGYDEIAATLDATPAATKQLVYEARTALHEMAEGRDMSCDSVRRMMSAQDGRALRGRKLRAHLKECAGCREFKDMMKVRRHDLAALTPALPAVAAASLLQTLGSAGHSGGALAGLAGGGAAKVAAGSAIAKGVATVAVVATVGAGAAGVTGNLPAPLTQKEAAPAVPAGGGVPEPIPGPAGAIAPGAGPTQRPASRDDKQSAAGKERRAGGLKRAAQRPARTPRGRRPAVQKHRGAKPAVPGQRADSRRPSRPRSGSGRPKAAPRGDKALPVAPAPAAPRRPAKPIAPDAETPETGALPLSP